MSMTFEEWYEKQQWVSKFDKEPYFYPEKEDALKIWEASRANLATHGGDVESIAMIIGKMVGTIPYAKAVEIARAELAKIAINAMQPETKGGYCMNLDKTNYNDQSTYSTIITFSDTASNLIMGINANNELVFGNNITPKDAAKAIAEHYSKLHNDYKALCKEMAEALDSATFIISGQVESSIEMLNRCACIDKALTKYKQIVGG